MFKLIFATLLVSVSVNAAFVELDSYTTKALDKLVRQNLIFMVVDRINDSIALQKSMQVTCANKINTTSITCQNCAKLHSNQPQGATSAGIMDQVLPILLAPAVSTGNLLKFVAKTAADKIVVDLLGKNIVKLGRDLGSTAKSAGNYLLNGATDLIGAAGDGLKDLGSKLTDLTSSIGHELDSFASNVAGLGTGFEHSLENIGNTLTSGATDAAKAIAHTAENVGNGIVHGISSIGHAIGHIFGRRGKRSVCPHCDLISGKTTQQIIDGICGSDHMTKQNDVITEITHMKEVYSAAVNTTIIHKVEYDPTSIETAQGVQFTKVFITFTVSGNPTRYSSTAHLRLTDLPTTAESLTNEIYESYV